MKFIRFFILISVIFISSSLKAYSVSYTRINGIEYRLEGDSASVTDITPVNANILPFVTHNGRTYSVNIIARRALRDGVETLQIPNTVTF